MGPGEAVSRPEFAPIRCEGLRGGWSPLIDPQAAYLKIGSAWVKKPAGSREALVWGSSEATRRVCKGTNALVTGRVAERGFWCRAGIA